MKIILILKRKKSSHKALRHKPSSCVDETENETTDKRLTFTIIGSTYVIEIAASYRLPSSLLSSYCYCGSPIQMMISNFEKKNFNFNRLNYFAHHT